MDSHISINDIVSYYEPKTRHLLQRYGPGPRVHYHTGLVEEQQSATQSIQELKGSLVTAQERMLSYAAELWNASSTFCGKVLDVGCGLGGGSLFWAQEFNADVTAVTIVPSHIDWVARFSEQAGVTSKVHPLLSDALQVPGEHCFDTAVAIESSCYLPRRAWFQKLSSLLRPGGHVFIADCFLGRSKYESPFNSYWRTQIGTIEEYIETAQEAGLLCTHIEDLSYRMSHFWTATLKLIQAEAQEQQLAPSEAKKVTISLQERERLREGFLDGGIHYALLHFSNSKQF